ncbi:MAG: phosphomannomutase/phosphoglucomutase [Thermoprotei archaeon]
MGIFKAYDIRGEYGSELTVTDAVSIGFSFGKWLKERGQIRKNQVAIGGDVRTSTLPLKEAMISGLISSGLQVLDLGMVPTPTVYFAVAHLGLDGGAVITASHLPAKYNGIKLVKAGGVALSYETGIGDIEKMVKDSPEYPLQPKGGVSSLDGTMDFYWAFIKRASNFLLDDSLSVAVDSGNGSCGYFSEALKREGYTVYSLFAEPDGTFPNHIPDPLREENLVDIKKEVLDKSADVGIAFDGDGDRLGIVDNLGRHVSSDQLLALLAAEELEGRPGGLIVHDILTSSIVDQVVEKIGGKILVSRTGHSYVNSAIIANRALMGGEVSGHIYYLDGYYGFDDASFAALKVLSLVSKAKKEGKDLAQLVNSLPTLYSSPEFRLPCPEDKKPIIISKLIEKLSSEGYKLNTTDGVRIDTEFGWGIARPSNTEPALALRFEGKDEESLKKVESLFAPTIAQVLGISLPGKRRNTA